MSMQRGVFREPGTRAAYNARAPGSILALRSPLVSVQLSDLRSHSSKYVLLCALDSHERCGHRDG